MDNFNENKIICGMGKEGGIAKQNKEILGSDGDAVYFKYGNGSMGVAVSIHQNLSS